MKSHASKYDMAAIDHLMMIYDVKFSSLTCFDQRNRFSFTSFFSFVFLSHDFILYVSASRIHYP